MTSTNPVAGSPDLTRLATPPPRTAGNNGRRGAKEASTTVRILLFLVSTTFWACVANTAVGANVVLVGVEIDGAPIIVARAVLQITFLLELAIRAKGDVGEEVPAWMQKSFYFDIVL